VKATSDVCLQVVKKGESVDVTSTTLMPECSSNPTRYEPTTRTETSIVASTTTLKRSKSEALNDLAIRLTAQGRVALSDSSCGSFAFFVSLDGSYHLYEWSDDTWISRAPYLGKLFPKEMKSVRSVDVTGDDVADFLITLPTWDPLSQLRPMSGAIFASVDCKWQWLTFRTTTKEDWYQLDLLDWDEKRGRIIAGDEVTNIFSPNYTGERKTVLRYFMFQESTGDFRLTKDKPTATASQGVTLATTVDPFASLPSGVRDAVKASCNWPAADLAQAYGVSSKSKKRIAEAVAADFQEQYQELVTPLCLLYIR
jgi:hypothetical protein